MNTLRMPKFDFLTYFFILLLATLASCSGCRFDMEFDLDLTKHQPRIKTTSILPQAAISGAEAAIQASEK